MIIKEEKTVGFNRKGFDKGIVTDSDPFDRVEGSLELCQNFDYDIETGEVQTRNSMRDSGLLDTFDMPDDYQIIPEGFQLFSFNAPVDRLVALMFIQHPLTKDVKIYTNWWFNPPAPNTEPDSPNNDYENFVSASLPRWQNKWVELTEKITLTDIVIADPLNLKTSTVGLSTTNNYYRGWFVWNSSHPQDTDQHKNESWVCVENYNNSTGEFTIQNRLGLDLTTLGWNNGDICYLVRYPITIHKTDWANITTIKIIKTNVSVKILVGQEGNLWFGFLNKDVTKTTATTNLNLHKYYGWWLDYEQYPVNIATVNMGSGGTYYTNSELGFFANTNHIGVVTNNYQAITLLLDFYQRICIFRLFSSSALSVGIGLGLFHHYTRRAVGCRFYSDDTGTSTILDDPIGYLDAYEEPVFSGGGYAYNPIYSYFVSFISNIAFQTDDIGLSARIVYQVGEQIYNKASFGVYTNSRMFEGGDSDSPDDMKYSVFQRNGIPTEDILPLQNSRPVSATDRDKVVGVDLLNGNPTIYKNNSVFIITVEQETEVAWRLLNTYSHVGCPYPRTIVRTPYGNMFTNDEGIWMLTGDTEPVNVLEGRRLQEYYSLPNKPIFGRWFAKHSEAWFYMGVDNTGNDLFWICKMNKKQLGWKDYRLPFNGNNISIIDCIVDDFNNFYIVATNKVIQLDNDGDTQTGYDYSNSFPISFRLRENFNTLEDSDEPFHWIESTLRFSVTPIVGGNQNIIVNLLDQNNNIIKSKTITFDTNNYTPKNIVLRNGSSDRNNAVKWDIMGQLTNISRFKIQELFTRFKPVPRPVGGAYSKIG